MNIGPAAGYLVHTCQADGGASPALEYPRGHWVQGIGTIVIGSALSVG